MLADLTEFERLTSNPVEDIKREANRTIEAINTATNARLNAILTPYVPDRYCVASSAEFLERIKDVHGEGVIALMDIEFRFTNVPVDEIIDFIADRVYRDVTTPELNIPEQALQTVLAICTKRALFTTHRRHMYLQKDDVVMGSPLVVLFVNFYMGVVEERVFFQVRCLLAYFCYIDDTFVKATSTEAIENLWRTFEDNSVLHFTLGNSVDNSLPFMDVLISSTNEGFHTTVYTKPTNIGMFLNEESEWPTCYKASSIKAFVRRALSHCSSLTDTHMELERAAQVLINNGYTNKQVQHNLRAAIDKWYGSSAVEWSDSASQGSDNTRYRSNTSTNGSSDIKLYYRGFMHPEYQRDDKAIKEIITNNVSPTDETTKVKLIIYYQTAKTRSLIMRNNPAPPDNDPLRKMNIAYSYQCPVRGCPGKYIGMTTMKLSKRNSYHVQQGAIRNQALQRHNTQISRADIVNNTKIIGSAPDSRRLRILEALLIQKKKKPALNTTQEMFLLPSCRCINARNQDQDPQNDDNPDPDTPTNEEIVQPSAEFGGEQGPESQSAEGERSLPDFLAVSARVLTNQNSGSLPTSQPGRPSRARRTSATRAYNLRSANQNSRPLFMNQRRDI
ncbi:uncharacterized protein [Palaemon carinicauda]|uniref:uncharacterized protein n=1 Tax=Palaemon carinicauda TaxID=392227 RepID=UPI0035B69E08